MDLALVESGLAGGFDQLACVFAFELAAQAADAAAQRRNSAGIHRYDFAVGMGADLREGLGVRLQTVDG